MTRRELIKELTELDYNKDQIDVALSDIFLAIGRALVRRDSVCIRGFGTFETRPRTGHNIWHPGRREITKVEDYDRIVFRPGENLKKAMKTKDPKQFTMVHQSDAD